MLTIKTKPDYTLGFIKYTEIKMHPSLPDGLYYYESQLEGGKDIGKLSEITEEQAKELVDLGKMYFKITTPECYDGKKQKLYVDLNELHEFDKFNGKPVGEAYKLKLKDAALSVGIEEKDFDKYLVVKL